MNPLFYCESSTSLVTRPEWFPRVHNWPANSPDAEAADHCFWIKETNYGNTESQDIDAGDIASLLASVGISSNVAGNQDVLSAKFTTRNTLPKNGTVVISLPHGYRVEAQVRICLSILGQFDRTCPSPCDVLQYCPQRTRFCWRMCNAYAKRITQ